MVVMKSLSFTGTEGLFEENHKYKNTLKVPALKTQLTLLFKSAKYISDALKQKGVLIICLVSKTATA